MVLVVNGVRILLAAVRSHIVTLAGPADVAVHNHLTVDGHLDSVALDTNLLGAPLPKRLVDDSLRRDHTVNRSVNLILTKFGVHRSVMIKDLHLTHSVIGSVNTH